MNIKDIINKKNNNVIITGEEIDFVVNNYVSGRISDEEMTRFLKSVLNNGMTFEETYNLTITMLNSGNIMSFDEIEGILVDKHSTGGVGDKTSFVVLPLAASCGVKIVKMSGRGLGFTGGTVDKLESIEGFKTELDYTDLIKQVNDINIVMISQSNNLVPADKKIYALRDVTNTTESIPLIASSIMSKKLASGSDKIVLDVKVGKGAFMKNLGEARELAKTMVDIGNKFGKETIAILTNMDYPLGYTIGNSIEVIEALDTLDNKGEERFTKLCLALASYMVSLGKNESMDKAVKEVEDAYYNRKGLKKFKNLISYQGGNINNIDVPNNSIKIYSNMDGYITDIDTMKLALLCNNLGAGRKNKGDQINHKVGIRLNKIINDFVNQGELLMQVYTEDSIDELEYVNCITIGERKIEEPKIIYEVIE
ncbi:MAG: thymidine phosphorylase [Bacilli bacterium]|nr:thymidine phosphorylase [Bacilli bacterium]